MVVPRYPPFPPTRFPIHFTLPQRYMCVGGMTVIVLLPGNLGSKPPGPPMALPAGGRVTVQLSCRKAYTSYGSDGDGENACPMSSSHPPPPPPLSQHITDSRNSGSLPRRHAAELSSFPWLRAGHSVHLGRNQSAAGRLYDIQCKHAVRLGAVPGL